MNQSNRTFGKIDFILIGCYLLLVLFGWLNIYSITSGNEDNMFFESLSLSSKKQTLWIGISLVVGFVILITDFKLFDVLGYVIYGIGIFLLLAVLIVGTEIKGAKSWIVLGGISFQPSELAKFTTSIAIAKYVFDHRIKNHRVTNIFLIGFFILVPFLLILVQNDLGSAIIFTFLGLVFFRLGANLTILFLGIWFFLIFIFTLLYGEILLITSLVTLFLMVLYRFQKFIDGGFRFLVLILFGSIALSQSVNYVTENVLAEHQRRRINLVLGIEEDPSGVGYNVRQSLIAISAGGVSGSGFRQGSQTRLKFVPEQKTDFIFSTIGEEWGFIGSFMVLLIYFIMLLRIHYLCEETRNFFVKTFGWCIFSIFFAHFFINIGSVIGIFPVIGVPLPFLSYGGSSLLIFTTMLFTFILLKSKENVYHV